ncbi:MAG: hypothetical protein PHH09_05050 [Methanoregulaceae archaeon]|nr:hypothetical protein [Methanoregulaceae archaeon]
MPEPEPTEFGESYVLSDTILETYLTNDPRAAAIALKAAASSVQAWYCREATRTIDALPLRGRKYQRDGTQARQFPREYQTPDGWWPDTDESDGSVAVPQDVIDACCEEAIAIYDRETTSTDRKARSDLIRQGVTHVTYSTTSETYAIGTADRMKGLESKRAYDLLAKYILRSAPIV